jgi:predicted PurR-regulated permease PerM
MDEKRSDSFDVAHVTLKILFIGLFIAASYWILKPFLIPLVWAALIVTATWPSLLKLQGWLGGRRGLAVTAMTLAMLLIVFIPVTLAVRAIVNNADDIVARVKAFSSALPLVPPEWVERIPFAGGKLASQWKEFAALSPDDRSAMAAPYARKALAWFVSRVGSMGMFLVQFLLTAVLTAILYANGEVVRKGALSFFRRLAGRRGEAAAILAGQAVRGVALGVVLTALMQTAVGGAGLLVAGVPGTAILIAVMFMLCLAAIGPGLIMIPAVIWLYFTGQVLQGTLLVIFTIPAMVMDNIIRPILIRKGADLPLLLVLAGVIGGLIAFGIIGLFIGPVVLAVSYTMLEAWVAVGDEGSEGADTAGLKGREPDLPG